MTRWRKFVCFFASIVGSTPLTDDGIDPNELRRVARLEMDGIVPRFLLITAMLDEGDYSVLERVGFERLSELAEMFPSLATRLAQPIEEIRK